MKKFIRVLPILLCGLFIHTATAQLSLTLPRGEWILQPGSPPQLQKEGLFTPPEQPFVGQLMPLMNLGQFAEALSLFRQTFPDAVANIENKQVFIPGGELDFNRASAAAFYMLGHVYLAEEQDDSAETAFLSALATVPDYIRVHESLGLLYLRMARFDDARPHLVRAAELGLNTANLFGALGYLNQELNNYWGAVSAYQDAMMLEPDNPQWQQGLLYSLAQTAQYDSALTLIDQLLQTRSDEAELWVSRAHMANQTGNKQAALASLETAIRLGDDSLNNLQVTSNLHMEIGSVTRAVNLLQRAVNDGMNFQYFDQSLSWLMNNGEWALAENLLESAPADNSLTSSERSSLQTRRATLNLNMGNTTAARTQLQEAIDLDGANASALMALAEIYRDASNYNQADLLYQRASADGQYRENAYISMAQLALDQNNYRRALTLLSDVFNTNPTRTDLRANIDILQNLVLASEEN